MATSADSLVREGTAAFKSGNRDKARELLMKAVEIDQYSEQGWLWLSAVVDSVEDQRTCLENVLAINPDNDRARNGLQTLIDQRQQQPPPQFGGSAPLPKPAARQAPIEEWPAPGSTSPSSTSVDWGVSGLETSSASSFRAVPEPSPNDYDDWLSNLNLPAAVPSTPPAPTQTAAFTSPFNEDDDDFGVDGPFSAPSVDDILNQLPPVKSSVSDAEASQSDASIRAAFRSSSRESALPLPSSTPAREAPKSPQRTSARPPARTPPPAVEPDFSDPFAGDIELSSTGLFTSQDDMDETKLEEMNADELFDYIPEEIKPTRLPGTVERYPTLLIAALVLLVLLNVGVAALLVYRLT